MSHGAFWMRWCRVGDGATMAGRLVVVGLQFDTIRLLEQVCELNPMHHSSLIDIGAHAHHGCIAYFLLDRFIAKGLRLSFHKRLRFASLALVLGSHCRVVTWLRNGVLAISVIVHLTISKIAIYDSPRKRFVYQLLIIGGEYVEDIVFFEPMVVWYAWLRVHLI